MATAGLSPIRIFIAHSWKDIEECERIATALREKGFEVWLDKWSIKVGESLTEKISQGISEGDFLIVVLSKNSVESHWVKKELSISLVVELEKKVVFVLPVLLNDCTVPLLVRDKKYADFRTSFEAGMDELFDAIESPQTESVLPSPPQRSTEKPTHIQELVNSLLNFVDPENKNKIVALSIGEKKKLIGEVLDRVALLAAGEDTSVLLLILERAILVDSRPSSELFEDFLREFVYRRPLTRERLGRVVAKYLEFSSIRESLKEHRLIEWLVREFEKSSSFAQGGTNSEMVSNLGPVLTEKQPNC